MWARLKPEEIEANKEIINKTKKRVFMETFWVGVVCFMISIMLIDLGYSEYCLLGNEAPKDLQVVLMHLPKYLAMSVIFSLLFAWGCSHMDANKVVCLKCGKTKSNNGNMICKCGGTYEFRNKVKWVDN